MGRASWGTQQKQEAERLSWILNFVFWGLPRGELLMMFGGLFVGGNFEINVGRAVWEELSATVVLGNN